MRTRTLLSMTTTLASLAAISQDGTLTNHFTSHWMPSLSPPCPTTATIQGELSQMMTTRII